MDLRYVLTLCTVMCIFAKVSARAVNISNTWVLPEEGFPVFYRYFRDRISWYEADAVCQFHHANLVTVDSTSQYDAIRAYLKELDIMKNVWIGLSKPNDKSNFLWRDFRPLSSSNYWQEAIPKTNEPICAAMDPVTDYRWHAFTCGGPQVASFICEFPVPSWASGSGGCLLTELPSLTVLYVPAQQALELTSDCGLDGTKRIVCKGNANRDEMVRQLACGITKYDYGAKSSKPIDITSQIATSEGTNPPPSASNIKTTKPWFWTSNTIDEGNDYGSPTRHRRETVDTMSPPSTKSTTEFEIKAKEKQASIQNATVTTITQESAIENINSSHFSTTTLTSIDQNTYGSTGTPDGQIETATKAAVPEASGDYPAAISQGQLFSIIENGTMFDIIELNETRNEDKNISINLTSKPNMQTITTPSSDYTEPPESSAFVTNTLPNIQTIKNTVQMKNEDTGKQTLKENNHNEAIPKFITKEIDPIPYESSSLDIKLNRTNRKNLPGVLEHINKNINLNVDNHLIDEPLGKSNSNDQSSDHILEIKLHDIHNTNQVQTTVFVTTRKMKKQETLEKDRIKTLTTNEIISPTVNQLSVPQKQTKSLNTNENINIAPKLSAQSFDEVSSEEIMKQHFLPKPLLSVALTPKSSEPISDQTSEESLESKSESQPRPNRQRQLTRTQRRSFYPYFFSRVLG